MCIHQSENAVRKNKMAVQLTSVLKQIFIKMRTVGLGRWFS